MSDLIKEIDTDDLGEETSRELASMQVIRSLSPIQGADRIELCEFEGVGWKCVVEKGLRAVGDLVCYIETDSILPEIPMFAWMAPYKYRVKTIKLRGQISQGIVIGLNEVLDYIQERMEKGEIEPGSFMVCEDDDVTQHLGITKFVKPIRNITGSQFGPMRQAGNFPSHIIPKTDEVRLQSKPGVLRELLGNAYVIRRKEDGSSLTCGYDTLRNDPAFCVCSRNNQILEDEGNAFWMAVLKYDLREKLKEYPWYWVQGELLGGKIQGNKLGIEGFDLHVFNIFDTRTNEFLPDDDTCVGLKCVAEFILGLTLCPEVLRGDIFPEMSVDQMVELSKGKYESGKQREGIVIRSQKNMRSEVLKDRMSFKVINPEFLLENGE